MKLKLLGVTGWKRYLLVYIMLLVASHLVAWLFDSPINQDNGADQKVMLQVVGAQDQLHPQTVEVAYEDYFQGSKVDKPTIVLLAGGPEGPEVFDQLRPKLSTDHRVIVPHLPGYGPSEEELPDYSFQALATYSKQLVRKLGLQQVHVVGYGLGGASAIHWAHNAGEQIESITLLSSIGVQELELLGGYTLNHAVYSIQLAAVWLLHNAIPHFGLFDALSINVEYAKSYYESDQRPIRSYLEAYKKPMLILHGEEDALVPLAAAQEHHRIVPQSKLKLYQADHDLVKTHSDSVSQTIGHFIKDVGTGEALTYAEASSERIQEAEKPFSNVDFAKFKGFSLLIIMLLIVVSTLISEDLTCIGAGLLAARGLIGFWPATLACLTGIFIGDVGLYLMGRFVGRSAVRKAPFKWFISEDDLDKSAEWFHRKGPMIIMASRFLPGSRFPTYFSAGVIGAGFWMFVGYFLLAAIIWTPILVGISQLLGNELLHYFSMYQDYAIWVFLGLVALLIMIAKVFIPAFSYRGRRLLVSRYRRLTRWQYWSLFLLYIPISCYIFYLGIKHRCVTLFTLANPEIPDGGFVGESKSAILSKFDDQYVGAFKLLHVDEKAESRIQQACSFMEEYERSFPVVLKPDIGQRGKGVRIVRSKEELKEYIQQTKTDLIIQEFIGGQEYGIFYYRFPNAAKGKIFSITTKNLVYVQGDGQRTMEELILDDDTAVTLAKYHLKQHEERLYDVPEKGEQVNVVELGTHARGAVFEEGEVLKTKVLERKLNEICNHTSGFYFGRLDLKAPTEEKLKRGEGLKVIEVNGVTSESTNIYDNEYSFFKGIGILCKQWKVAFEIGNQHRRQGGTPSSFGGFLKRTFKTLLEERSR
ncbi:alpha/beta fold hydrolase [Fodinibius salsisoli]|uniref:Alpha/beta fold hydrolase n=1 Tax=Fodinibius salsisoli TaxID=2820877 RepID=A0ABT3PR19_9BACT|nr:alpha/beta fold hydrolase [Fodinibius salsisoli]MCW9708299.1 alpha/beta fold hydrolase [Fodinibius salsisoli]